MVKTLLSGKPVLAIAISQNMAVGSWSLDEANQFGMRSPMEIATTPRAKLPREDEVLKDLREVSQRSWDKGRKTRATDYKSYIGGLYNGTIHMGGTPAINIFIPDQGVEEGDALLFPFNAPVICIDGETQMEARYQLAAEQPETKSARFAVTIWHGISPQHAAQILHDFNTYGVRISETKIGYRNTMGPVSQLVVDARAKAQLDDKDFNLKGKTGTKKMVAGFGQSCAFAVGYVSGKPSLTSSWSNRFFGLNKPDSGHINGAATTGLTEMFEIAKTDKDIGSASPNIWHAAGVLLQEGRQPKALNWQAAFAAMARQSSAGRGNTGPISQRLTELYDALKS